MINFLSYPSIKYSKSVPLPTKSHPIHEWPTLNRSFLLLQKVMSSGSNDSAFYHSNSNSSSIHRWFFSFSQVSRGGFPHLFGDKSFHLYVLFISSLDLVYLFPLQAFIFYRLLPFSLDMCLISLSSRNFSNLLNCCLASFFGGKKIYTHCFQSCNVTEAALAGNK